MPAATCSANNPHSRRMAARSGGGACGCLRMARPANAAASVQFAGVNQIQQVLIAIKAVDSFNWGVGAFLTPRYWDGASFPVGGGAENWLPTLLSTGGTIVNGVVTPAGNCRRQLDASAGTLTDRTVTTPGPSFVMSTVR